MMRIIAHRGNIEGVHSAENKPEYIQKAIDTGFDVEIDVWYDEGEFFLGHDKPQYRIELKQLEKWAKRQFVYAHCKNAKSAMAVPFSYGIIPFAHSEDDFIILPDMHLWVHPKAIITLPVSVRKDSIIVADSWTSNATEYHGICSNYPGTYKRVFNL